MKGRSKPGEAPRDRPTVARALRVVLGSLLGLLVLGGLWATRFGERWPSVYYMTGASMEPTLAAGEHFIVWSPADDLERGDLVIFRFEDEDEDEDEDGTYHVLRRLVGLPGDTVEMEGGVVRVNGEVRDWVYRIVSPDVWRSELAIAGELFEFGPWVVPRDSAVVLADTRDMVGWPDSRFQGFIALDAIRGRATRTVTGRRLR